MRKLRFLAMALLAVSVWAGLRCQAQGALLMEEPYGFFGALNPTGHTAVYLARVCAETPVSLRRCHEGEMGVVISRYRGIRDYDWIAIPLIPYLYSVEEAADAPTRVNPAMVHRLRDHYREAHLTELGEDLPAGGFFYAGWAQLIGVSYERRIFALRFNTSAEQDDRLIAQMNADPNQSHFNILFNNCADFARALLDVYYPGTFKRSIFPDAGMTTPKQIAYKLARYGRKHPETGLAVYEIPQIPGYHRRSRSNKDVAESLATGAYAVPLAIASPYLLGGIFADYLVRSHHGVIPKHPEKLEASMLSALAGKPGEPTASEHLTLYATGSAHETPEDAARSNTGFVKNSVAVQE